MSPQRWRTGSPPTIKLGAQSTTRLMKTGAGSDSVLEPGQEDLTRRRIECWRRTGPSRRQADVQRSPACAD